LEVAEKMAKDAADDLQAVVECKFAWSLNVEFLHLLGLSLIFRPWVGSSARETEGALKKELAEVKDQVTVLKERTAEVQRGEWSSISRRSISLLVGGLKRSAFCLCRSGEESLRPQGGHSVPNGHLRSSGGGGGAKGAARTSR
jgi:hypothetical protein